MKGTLEARLTVDDGHSDGPFISWRGVSTLQDLGGYFLGCAVDYDCFKALTGELLDCAIEVSAVFNPDLQISQHAAQYADDGVIRAQQQRL